MERQIDQVNEGQHVRPDYASAGKVRRLPMTFSTWRSPLFWFAIILPCFIADWSSTCHAQDDYYPLPERDSSGFGFPYPPPAADEPGVSFNRRYMLDGHPELEFSPRPEDEVWLVSTRNFNESNSQAPVALDQFICKHPEGTGWSQVPVQQFIDVQRSHSDVPTVVFIHGNRTSDFWSRRRGKLAYQVLIGNNPNPLPPIRFVIWSWPSDPIKGPLKDFDAKSQRCDLDGPLLGQFLSRLNHSQPVTVISYSLGTQIALTGVETASPQGTSSPGESPKFNLLAMAPVTRCNWPQSPANLAVIQNRIQQVRLFRNPDDIAINAFRFFCRFTCNRPDVLGADRLSQSHPHVVEYDVSDSVGREHNVVGYLSQPVVRAELESLLTR